MPILSVLMKINLSLNPVLATLAFAGTALAVTIPVGPTAVLFENDQVKVIRAIEKPHVKGKSHDHKMNRVMVYLQPGRQRFEYQDGRKAEEFDWHAGQVTWNKASGMHSPEVVSGEPFDIIEIELKNTGSEKPVASKLDPVKVDPKDYSVEFENAQVRVIRAKLGPHAVAPMHEHPLNRVTVFLTDQDFSATDSQGKTAAVKHIAGDVVWGTPILHTEKNLTDRPFEVVSIELKN